MQILLRRMVHQCSCNTVNPHKCGIILITLTPKLLRGHRLSLIVLYAKYRSEEG
ncbi:uncharacterized protein BJ212DRAFT_1369281 [Suillus subaureus]|uniref:Uncharacterized protein n=1 Tax=Suillus subaureus TaxID=48587 RepID=A0A9P7E6Y4_9AGAM|nr:uncharacterized protein BJ212DRAFT_1369281 [Suillus subaureus]KAG1812954.1 hypothetical protein BJ212DRAFT_1369281 [Suillus subaureus]